MWAGGRWRSYRHRVPPTPASAPDEELASLVCFHESGPHAAVSSLPPPVGVRAHSRR
jgi:hypothetical protein